jgi:hypothetical protein
MVVVVRSDNRKEGIMIKRAAGQAFMHLPCLSTDALLGQKIEPCTRYLSRGYKYK